MSATHLGCGCVINRDADMQLVSLGCCERHRWELGPELDALYFRLLELRSRERAPLESTPGAASPGAATDGPDLECVFVDEDPIELIRKV